MGAPTNEPLTLSTSFLSRRQLVEDTHGAGAFSAWRTRGAEACVFEGTR